MFIRSNGFLPDWLLREAEGGSGVPASGGGEGTPNPEAAPSDGATQTGEGQGQQGAAASPGEGQPAAPEAQAAKPPVVDWREKRIATLTAKLREKEALLAAQQQAPPPAGETGEGQRPAGPTAQEIERVAQLRAQVIAEERRFAEECTKVGDEGRKAFPDFQTRVNALAGLGDFQSDPEFKQQYLGLLNAAMEAGPAAKILHALGGDLNRAQELLAMSPARLGAALGKMAAKLESGGPTGPSGAHKPITPVGTRGGDGTIAPDSPESDKLSTAVWMERRNKQVAERNKLH